MGNIVHSQGNNPEAIEIYQQSLKFFEELSDRLGIAKCLGTDAK
jgi:hypothetical protein